MSNAALNWAFSTALPKAVDKLLLVCLANYADDTGLCFPSQAKIVGDTSLDRKTVIAGMGRLAARGLITDTNDRKGATRQVVVWRLALNGPVNGTVPSFPVNSPVFPDEASRISRETVPQTGHGTTIEPPVEPPGEPSLVAREPVAADLFGETPAPKPGPAPTEARPAKPPRAKARSAMPPDWWPSPAGIAFAAERGMDAAALPEQVQRFRDNHEARATLSANWDANWRTWAGNFRAWSRTAPAAKAARPSVRDSMIQMLRGPPSRGPPEPPPHPGETIEANAGEFHDVP